MEFPSLLDVIPKMNKVETARISEAIKLILVLQGTGIRWGSFI